MTHSPTTHLGVSQAAKEVEVNRFLVVLRTVFSLYMKPVTRNTFTYNTYSRCESDERRGAPHLSFLTTSHTTFLTKSHELMWCAVSDGRIGCCLTQSADDIIEEEEDHDDASDYTEE